MVKKFHYLKPTHLLQIHLQRHVFSIAFIYLCCDGKENEAGQGRQEKPRHIKTRQ